MADAILKKCTRCGECKPKTDFIKSQGKCRPCYHAHQRERYANDAEHREKIKATNRAWAAANKETKAAGDRAYREANKERCYATGAAWRMANQERSNEIKLAARHRDIETYRAREAAYRAKNREACNDRIKEWKRRNPHTIVAYFHKRRAAELQAIPAWADLDAIAAVFARAQTLGPSYHVDHTVPLISKFVCGLHCEANLQVIPAEENMKKNNKRWPDMWP